MRRTVTAVLAAVMLTGGEFPRAQPPAERLEFSAVAISAGGPLSSPVAAQLDIIVERWSTEEERTQLMDALVQGQDAAVAVLARFEPVGSVRTRGNLRWVLRFAQQVPQEDGGRRIWLVTDRPMSFSEVAQQSRTVAYPFTIIELAVNDKGEGGGKLSQAVKMRFSKDGRFLTLENYDVDAVDLTQVKPAK